VRSNAGLCTELRNHTVLFSDDDGEGKIFFSYFFLFIFFFLFFLATEAQQEQLSR
jgi:hypothetical protein